MEVLEIAETSGTPKIILNPEKGEYVFSGRSLPEDSADFYRPVMKWFEMYSAKPIPDTRFEFRLSYFNTASSKMFFSIFQVIDQINMDHPAINNKAVIYTTDDDEDLFELFEYFKELLNSNCLELQSF